MKNVTGLVLQNILLDLFTCFRLSQLAIQGRREFAGGRVWVGEICHLDSNNQQVPNSALSVSPLAAQGPRHQWRLGAW